jgi:hypothetical protein
MAKRSKRITMRPLFISAAAILAMLTTAASAADQAKSAAVPAVVNSTGPALAPVGKVSVSVSPSRASLNGGQSATFTAKVSGSSNTNVTWSLSPQVGTIASGVYQAPAIIASQQTVQVTATSVADPTKSATASVTLNPVAVTLSSSGSTSLTGGESVTFTAKVSDASSTAVTWSLSSQVGTIANGVYKAPAIIASQQTLKVIATSVADPTKFATATVTLNPVAVTLSASGSTSLTGGESVTFTAKLSGTSNTAVTWSLSSQVGTIANGVYKAPAIIASQQTVQVTATSVVDPTKFATGTVTLNPIAVTVSSSGSTSLIGGQSATFTAKVSGTSSTAVTWSLSPQVGTIASGVYKAPAIIASQQSVQVIATSVADPTKFATGTVTLNPIAVTVSSSGSTSLIGGQSATFTAKVSDASNTAVTWSLSPQVGTIASGVYKAPAIIASQQSVQITATSVADPTKFATATVTLNPIAVTLSSSGSTSLSAGQSATFTAKVSGTSNTSVTWSLSPQVGTIASGVYKAPAIIASQQSVTVIATSVADPTKTASATVSLIPVGVTVGPTSVSLGVGASATFTASVTGTSNTAVTWSLSPAVGTFVNGVYTAPATISSTQTVTLTAMSMADPTKTASATISLIPVGITLGPPTASLGVGASATFTPSVTGTSNTAVTWSLSPAVGTVMNGVYTAPSTISSLQTVTLTATSVADPTKAATVTITLTPVVLTLSPTGATSLTGGQSATFTATISGTTNTAVTWSLSTQVGTITNGVYQAPTTIVGQQSVTVTATSVADSTKTASATVSLIPVGVTVGPPTASLGGGASATFAASVTGSSNTAVTWSLSSPVGTVVNGVYTAPTIIGSAQTVTLTATSVADPTQFATATITLTPTLAAPSTPHFGNDGSQLTSYVPGKSMFVRSMFFSLVPQFSQYVSAFKAAQLNTVESGFYPPPQNNYSSVTKWETNFNGFVSSIETAANVDGFNIILTGDDIARGSGAVYDAVSGPSTAWTPDPITYAFTWAGNLGKVIGVEMVDEISFQFAVPFPQGQLGQPNGPQQISCVNDLCTVTWPTPLVIENGDLTFLITGATSNANLNRPVSNLYHQNAGFNNGFTFNTTGIGTQTFTAATDPNLTFEMFASIAEPENTPGATDYIHNNAISQIMSYIDAAPNRPSVTWPAAAAAPGPNFGAWAGPGAADYGDIYFTYLGCTGPGGVCLPNDALNAFNYAWNAKYPYAQPGKPVLMETGDYGTTYNINGVPIPVTSFDGNTIVFSQPHGVTTPIVGITGMTTRLSVSGSSNSALNGNYYVYAVTDPSTLEVYPASFSGASTQGGTVTFFDGQTVNITVFPTQGALSPAGMQMDGAPYCLNADNFGQLATVSNSAFAPYNAQWFVFPGSLDGLDANGCTWALNMAPLRIGSPGTGGTASLIIDNYYHPGVSTLVTPGTTPDVTAANIMYAAEKGAAGVRVYMFGGDANQNQALSSCFTNCNTHIDANPIYNGPEAQATWQGLSNAFNLIDEIEPFLLQSQLPSPDYGPTMITAARTSSNGILLLMTEFANTPQTVTVDLSAYNPSGGAGTMYTMTGEELNQQSISGTSVQVTFAPAETVAFTFPAGN